MKERLGFNIIMFFILFNIIFTNISVTSAMELSDRNNKQLESSLEKLKIYAVDEEKFEVLTKE